MISTCKTRGKYEILINPFAMPTKKKREDSAAPTNTIIPPLSTWKRRKSGRFFFTLLLEPKNKGSSSNDTKSMIANSKNAASCTENGFTKKLYRNVAELMNVGYM